MVGHRAPQILSLPTLPTPSARILHPSFAGLASIFVSLYMGLAPRPEKAWKR